MIYFTSDTHYAHKNICKGVSNWENKESCRNFSTIEEMNDAIVNNINAVVKENDVLYHLGDWSFGGIEKIWEFRKKLNCKNIHLILGNHDHHIARNSLIAINQEEFIDGDASRLEILYDSEVPYYNGKVWVPVRNLFSSVEYLNPKLNINGKIFVLCHYAMRVWNESHRAAIMLYGHSHGTLDELSPKFTEPTWIGENYYIKNSKTMDVGIDAHPDFRPYSMSEIVDIMKYRDILFIDHHNENTN